MNKSMKNAGFGRKDTGENALSFAQMLLSGKPLARPASSMDFAVPRIKAKRKVQFGRNDAAQFEDASNDKTAQGPSPWWQIWTR